MSTLTVPTRFNGPPSSGNGGWTAGAFDELAPCDAHATTVQLRKPPPLETPIEVTPIDRFAEEPQEWATGTVDGALVLRARAHHGRVSPVEPVDLATARAAQAAYAGLTSHPFPTCFVCGTDREPGDGMRIWPGRVADDSEGRTRVAAVWTPTEPVTSPMMWAALDCIGGWAGDLAERMMVLGQMTFASLGTPDVGEELVIVGGDRGTDGVRTSTAATMYAGTRDRVVATAEHVWFAVDPKDFA